MKSYLRSIGALALVAAIALFPALAMAQVVTQLPVYLDNSGAVYDFGNGPLEVRILQGSAGVFTSSGSGLGSGTTTAITLTATPASNPPCVGCRITGAGIVGVTTITAYNGTTGITVDTSQTIGASTPLAWGAACPASSAGYRVMLLQPGQPPAADLPLYTAARVCGGSQYTAGATAVTFPIGAH